MKLSFVSRAVAVLALSAAAFVPAQASLIDFEDVVPSLGDPSFSSGGFDIASGGTGFSGVDTADAFVFGNAPANSQGQFIFGLNTDSLTLTNGGNAFRLFKFDASFIAPLGGLGAGISAGQLRVDAVGAGGEILSDVLDFSVSDAFGNFNFTNMLAGNVTSALIVSATFSACVYTDTGCSFADNQAQFALDNIQIPEPGSVALTLAALGLLAATRRRQSI